MKSTVILFITGLLVLASANNTLFQGRLLQTAQRTSSVNSMCAKYASRANLIDADFKTQADSARTSTKASFSKSGNQLIGSILSSPDKISALQTQIQPMTSQLSIYLGPFMLGLVVNMFIWMLLCCCCCCPQSCPAKPCRNPQQHKYTKIQLIWPTIMLILSLLLVIIGSGVGLSKSRYLQQSYSSVSCSLAIAFDDLMHGNISSTGKLYLGLKQLSISVDALKNKIPQVQTQMQKLLLTNAAGATKSTYDQGTTMLSDISMIPTGTAGAPLPAYSYTNFDGSPASIASTFPSQLGSATTSSNSAIGSGTMYDTYSTIYAINQVFDTLSKNAYNWTSQLADMSNTLTDAKQVLDDMYNAINDIDTVVGGMDVSLSSIMETLTLGLTAAFGALIGLATIGILSAFVMTFCGKQKCRHVLYFICFLFTILGILFFLIAVVASLFTPILLLGCDFLQASLSSQQGFTTNIGNSLPANMGQYLKVCMPGGSGNFMAQITAAKITPITGIISAYNTIKGYDVTASRNIVQGAFTSLYTFVQQHMYTDVYDFSSDANLNYMKKIADPTLYASCTSNNFQNDRWVPSIRQAVVGCGIATHEASSPTQCGSSAVIQSGYNSGAGSCYGCIDSVKVLATSFAGSGISTDLSARYSGCGAWVADIGNLWNNYYAVKGSLIVPMMGRYATAYADYATPTSGYKDLLASTSNSFNTIAVNLQSAVGVVFNNVNGMVVGVNCLIMGEDLNLVIGTACGKLFTLFYYLRIAVGMIAFGMLFSMCCGTCAGVRAYKDQVLRATEVLPENSRISVRKDSTMIKLEPAD